MHHQPYINQEIESCPGMQMNRMFIGYKCAEVTRSQVDWQAQWTTPENYMIVKNAHPILYLQT